MTSAQYVRAVIQSLRDLPATASRFGPADRRLARSLYDQNVPLAVVRDALLIATARRIAAVKGCVEDLPAARSLAYFSHTIAEVRRAPLETRYLAYLRRTIRRTSDGSGQGST